MGDQDKTEDQCRAAYRRAGIDTALHLTEDKKNGVYIDLVADYRDMEQFIQVHQVKSVKDLEVIRSSNLWLRYLAGDGYVVCDIDHIDAEVCFEVAAAMRPMLLPEALWLP